MEAGSVHMIKAELKGVAFVYQLPDGTLTLDETGKHVATIDLQLWFAYLIEHTALPVGPGWIARLERVPDDVA